MLRIKVELGRKQHAVLANIGICVYKYIFIWRANLQKYDTRDVGLSDGMNGVYREIKIMCLQQGFPFSYRWIGPKP